MVRIKFTIINKVIDFTFNNSMIERFLNMSKYYHCFGIVEIKKLKLPKGVIKYKIKMSNTDYIQIFLKYADKVEQRMLKINGYGEFRCGVILRSNIRKVKDEIDNANK